MSATAYYNARIYTGSNHRCSALGIHNGQIAALGSDTEVCNWQPTAAKIDLEGAAVFPGFIDAHIHMQGHGLNLSRTDLKDVASLLECQEIISNRLTETSTDSWVLGRGWNFNLWAPPKHPTRADLDPISPDRPVALSSVDGHLLWANSRALEIANITASVSDPDGGRIYRDPDTGEPTGIFAERAKALILDHVPSLTVTDRRRALQNAVRSCLSVGLTGVHDCDGGLTHEDFHALRDLGEYPLRVYLMVPVSHLNEAIDQGVQTGQGDDMLRTGPVKIFADGALGPKTAAMLDPYRNTTEMGIVVTPREELVDIARRSFENGLDIAVHAIGDRAVRNVLDAVQNADATNRRPRVEHAQITHPSDIPRFAQLGVIASMQPIHATADMRIADQYLGPTARWSYAWQSLKNAGAVLAFGSDSPVEPHSPLAGIHAAVTRQTAEGVPEMGWYPEECVDVHTAIRAYTQGAAYASGEEHTRGSLEPGKLGDFVVLSQDITQIPPAEILNTKVLMTVVGGQVTYDAR